jgi:hypothetical protein
MRSPGALVLQPINRDRPVNTRNANGISHCKVAKDVAANLRLLFLHGADRQPSSKGEIASKNPTRNSSLQSSTPDCLIQANAEDFSCANNFVRTAPS